MRVKGAPSLVPQIIPPKSWFDAFVDGVLRAIKILLPLFVPVPPIKCKGVYWV